MNCKICNTRCLNNVKDVCLFSCGHMFHSLCIEKWYLLSDDCPICNIKSVCVRHDTHSNTTLSKLYFIQKENIKYVRMDVAILSKEVNLLKSENYTLETKLNLIRSVLKEIEY